MKTKLHLAAMAVALATCNLPLATTARAQGSLTPPAGAPAPVMKSLDQIEARTPITNRTSIYHITQPGSYYLTGNLTVAAGDGISIETNNVSLDLNGFTIRSTATPASGSGVNFHFARQNVSIRNGFICGSVTNNNSYVFSGSGFAYGIGRDGDAPSSVQVSRIQVQRVLLQGIELSGYGNQVDNCTVYYCGWGLIADTVTHCRVEYSGGGILAETVADSFGFGYNATGISAKNVINSKGESQSGYGIECDNAMNCHAFSSSSSYALHAQAANNCYAIGAGGRAILATVANGCYVQSGTNNITYKYNMP